MTKTIMSAISSALRTSDAFNLACDILAASNISVSTNPGLMVCVCENKSIKYLLFHFPEISQNIIGTIYYYSFHCWVQRGV